MNSKYTNFKYKYINDPIYGGIGLSEFEVDLINTRIFQRLRHIRQLALVNYVFPGAEHSRFVHSLGVLYIMGKMTEHLLSNEDIGQEEQIKLRTAALLHDIGHYPFSHLGEAVYRYKEASVLLKSYEPKDSRLTILSNKIQNKKAHHERLGQYIISNNREIAGLIAAAGLDPEEIGSIITGELGPDNPSFFAQLMHSSLDADRLDYLIRDSFQTGVQYGRVDLDYLIRLLKVVKIDVEHEGESQEDRVLGVNIKGQHVVEHYLMSRYFHYSQVIGHKTSLAFEAVAKALIYKLVDAGKFIFNSYKEITQNVNDEKFLYFTDDMLVNALKSNYYKTADEDFKLFYDILKQRRRPKTLIELKDIRKKASDCRDLKYYTLKRLLTREPEKLSEWLGLNREHIGYQEFPVTIESIPSYVTIAQLKSKNSMEEEQRDAVKLIDSDKHVSLLALQDQSIIHRLTDLVSNTIRVFYIEPPESTSEDNRKRCEKAYRMLIKEIEP